MRTRYKLYFWLGMLCFALMAGFSVWSLLRLRESIEHRKLTGAVSSKLDDVLEAVQAADVALLYFQRTEDRAELEEFVEAYGKVETEFAELSRLAASPSAANVLGGAAVAGIGDLGRLLREKAAMLQRLGQSASRSEAAPELHQELEFTDSIRNKIGEIDGQITRALETRELFLNTNFENVLAAIVFLLTATFSVLLIFLRVTSSEMERRSRLEAELRRANEAAINSSSQKSDFLAMISHEIRTPLNGIIGMSELIQGRAEGDLKRYASVLHESGKSLLRIVNDVLDFSKVEAGKMDFELQEVSLGQVIEMSLELFSARARTRGLELTAAYAPEFGAICAADGARLAQVLQNFLGNSLKFTNAGYVHVEGEARPGEEGTLLFRLSVEDSGPGIPLEEQARVFQPFRQGKAPRREPGTGLGLSICRRLVEAMEGKIGFQSTPGQGSRFWFEVPLRVLRPAPTPAGGEAIVYGALSDPRFRALDSYARLHQRSVRPFREGETISGLLAWPGEAAAARPPGAPLTLVLGAEDSRVEGDVRYLAFPISPARIDHLLKLEARAPARGTAPVAAPREDLGEGKLGLILLVEDNPTNQLLAQTQLEQIGYQVQIADNGQAALDISARLRFDLVLMDCQMPVMDGLEATRRLRAREVEYGVPRLPVIAMTANAFVSDRDRAFAAGMDDFLTKPFELKNLHQTIQKWIAAKGPELDWSVLDDLARKTSADVVKRLLRSFVSTLEAASATVESGDENAVRRTAHQIKASAASIGARRLADVAIALEAHEGEATKERQEFLESAKAVLQELRAQTRF